MSTTNQPNTQQGNGGASPRPGTAGPSNQSTEGLKRDASRLAQDATRQGKAQADHYRDVAADRVDDVADRIKAAAGELDKDGESPLSSHITTLADGMGKLSSDLREKSGDELLRDVNRLARQNPGMFVAGGVAVGFGLARLMKATARSPGQASADWSPRPDQSDPGAGGYRPGAAVGIQDGWDQVASGQQGGTSTPAGGTAERTDTGSTAASGSARSTLSTSGPGSAADAQQSGEDDNRSKLQ